MSTTYITRIFSLDPINIRSPKSLRDTPLAELYQQVFAMHNKITNLYLEHGRHFPDSTFQKEQMVSVKAFYDKVRRIPEVKEQLDSSPLKERLYRCAAQFSYFLLREIIRTRRKISLACEELISSWPSYEPRTAASRKSLRVKQSKGGFVFPPYQMINRVRRAYIDTYDEVDGITEAYLGKWFRFVRNQLYEQLTTTGVQTDLSDLFADPSFHAYLEEQLLDRYQPAKLEKLLGRYLQSYSRRLTTSFKYCKQKGKISKILANFLNHQQLDRPVQDCSREQWDQIRQQWRDQQYSEILPALPYLDLTTILAREVDSCQPDGQFWRYVLYNRQPQLVLGMGRGLEGFVTYLRSALVRDILRLAIPYFAPSLQQVTDAILGEIGKDPAAYMSEAEVSSGLIPLGIDDGSIYQVWYEMEDEVDTAAELRGEDVRISLSFFPYHKITYRLNTPERFTKVIREGWKPRLGQLELREGKLLLHFPFEHSVAELSQRVELKDNRVLGIDLGIKTLATMSLAEEGREVDRQFFDQHDLVGPKDQWWLGYEERRANGTLREQYEFVNYKQKLFHLQKQNDSLRGVMARLRQKHGKPLRRQGRSYTSTHAYWRVRRKWKANWGKIRRIHTELVRQISARIVCYARSMQVGTVIMEDLSWRRQGGKKQVGYFLTTWLHHWFYGQLQQAIEAKAERVGMAVEYVSPRGSSKLCSGCGRRGKRDGKVFRCDACELQLDSDLNAARNLVSVS